MTERRGRRTRCAGAGLGALALLAAAGADAQGPRDRRAVDAEPLSVVLATWRAEAFGRVATGSVGWVAACDGSVRLDLDVDPQPTVVQPMVAQPVTPRPGTGDPGAAWPPVGPGERTESFAGLLAREGRGWTLVAPPVGEGLFGAWDREWSAPPSGLAELARGVTHRAGGTASAGDRESFVLAAEAAQAPVGPAGAGEPGLRRQLAVRARGGGGPGERVHVEALAGGGAEVRSSRRPGRLVVTPSERRPTSATPEEVFLPWWSLGEILALPAPPEPGTSPEGLR